MDEGIVVSIQIARAGRAPMELVPDAEAIAGKGLAGDRYFKKDGKYSGKLGPGREVTLIESEAVLAILHEHGIELAPKDSRRNIATRGVRLNDLVGREFTVGGARLRGIRLCEPCSHLSELTGKELVRPLSGRGGLRAEIVESGKIRTGDPVRAVSPRVVST